MSGTMDKANEDYLKDEGMKNTTDNKMDKEQFFTFITETVGEINKMTGACKDGAYEDYAWLGEMKKAIVKDQKKADKSEKAKDEKKADKPKKAKHEKKAKKSKK
jgi:hypothetical protein